MPGLAYLRAAPDRPWVPRTAVERIVVEVVEQQRPRWLFAVVRGLTVDAVVPVGAAVGVVDSVPSIEGVVSGLAIETVVAIPTVERVVSAATGQRVVPVVSEQLIVSCVADKRVGVVAAVDSFEVRVAVGAVPRCRVGGKARRDRTGRVPVRGLVEARASVKRVDARTGSEKIVAASAADEVVPTVAEEVLVSAPAADRVRTV